MIRDLPETRLPLLEALRQRIGFDSFDPLDALAQVVPDAEIQRLRRSSLEAKDPPVGDQPRREGTLWWCASNSLPSRRRFASLRASAIGVASSNLGNGPINACAL